jgi:hypothetical protein
MTEADPPGSQVSRSESAEIAYFPASRRPDPPAIAFDRHELRQIMNLYGRMVAYGEWRDYAIDFLRDKAVFSIFRRASEIPLYRIVKDPALAQRQGAYSVLAPTGMIVKRGHDLARVLQAIDKPVRVVV